MPNASCPRCGTTPKPQAKFCTGCGAPVADADGGSDYEALRELPLAAWPEMPTRPDAPVASPPAPARPAWLYVALGALATLALVLGGMQFGLFGTVAEDMEAADGAAAAAMAGMTDAEKIAAFRDDFQAARNGAKSVLPVGGARDLAQSIEPRGVAGKGRHQHAARQRRDFLQQAGTDHRLASRAVFVEHIGRIAHHGEHAAVTDRAQCLRRGGDADQWLIVQFPIAGVENPAIGRVDDQRIAFRNRVRQWHIGAIERAEVHRAAILDNAQFDAVAQPMFGELMPHQTGGKRRRIERHAQIGGEIGHRADVILMPMGQDDAEQIVLLPLDKFQIGQDQFNAGIIWVGKGHAQIDHDPFAIAAVEIDVHANFRRAAKGQKQ